MKAKNAITDQTPRYRPTRYLGRPVVLEADGTVLCRTDPWVKEDIELEARVIACAMNNHDALISALAAAAACLFQHAVRTGDVALLPLVAASYEAIGAAKAGWWVPETSPAPRLEASA
jgi:hypothetical protein